MVCSEYQHRLPTYTHTVGDGGEEYGKFNSTKTKARVSVSGGDGLFGDTTAPGRPQRETADDDLFPSPPLASQHTTPQSQPQVHVHCTCTIYMIVYFVYMYIIYVYTLIIVRYYDTMKCAEF